MYVVLQFQLNKRTDQIRTIEQHHGPIGTGDRLSAKLTTGGGSKYDANNNNIIYRCAHGHTRPLQRTAYVRQGVGR